MFSVDNLHLFPFFAGIERKFDVEPEPQEAFVGGVARLQCKIQAVPPPIYIWEFNKNGLPQSDNRYVLPFISSPEHGVLSELM